MCQGVSVCVCMCQCVYVHEGAVHVLVCVGACMSVRGQSGYHNVIKYIFFLLLL